ncbi:MAG: PAS domain-containing protein, partial [Spirochaetaceae bacterium]|nr:PAS domain-containing protein [Spirochaetaceae bacterium]
MKTVFGTSLRVLTLAALGLSFSFILAILLFMNSLYYETNTRNLQDTARLLMEALPDKFFHPGTPRKPGAFPEIPGDGSRRLTLIDREGTVIGDSHFDPRDLENHRDRPEVSAALEGREGSSRRKSDTAGLDNIYAALPIYGSGKAAGTEVAGVFRLSMSVPNFWRRIAAAALPYLYLPLLIILAAFGAVFIFSRSLGKSFESLVLLTRTVSDDAGNGRAAIPDLGAPPLISDTEEFILLEQALRSTAAELQARINRARREKGRLEAILNGMSEVVFAMDRDLKLHLVNPRARALFQIEGDIANRSLLDLTHSTGMEAAARKVLDTGKSLEWELKFHAAGSEHRFRAFAGPLGMGEEPEGVVLVLGDITRLVKLEQVRKDFVANVSHELRTPIQLVKGFAETLLDALDDREALRHGIGIIQKNAEAMENLTTDLLSLAALEDETGPRPE